jgi:hypothetical protein
LYIFNIVNQKRFLIFVRQTKKTTDMAERFSMREVLKEKFGEVDKSIKGTKSTKRASDKVKSNGKYEVKIVDGVKYMVLK